MRVHKLYSHQHRRPIESIGYAAQSGDMAISDRRDGAALVDADGIPLWDKILSFAPLTIRVTADGAFVYILTTTGRLLKVTRGAELEWETMVERDPVGMAIRPDGKMVAVASHKGRFHLVDRKGKRVRMVHTPQPVAHVKFAARTGTLVAASSFGWVGLYQPDGDPVGEFEMNERIMDLKVSGRGKRIFVPGLTTGLHVIELETSQLASYEPGFSVTRVGADDAGNRMVVSGPDGGIAALDRDGAILWQEKSPHSWVFCEMNGAGDRFAAVSDKGLAQVYSLGAGPQVETPPPPPPVPDPPKVERKKRPPKGDDDSWNWIEV